LTDVVVRTAQLVADHREIIELDLNPVLASPAGVTVTDAIVRVAPEEADHHPLRRLG
jgi:hypothetical protein